MPDPSGQISTTAMPSLLRIRTADDGCGASRSRAYRVRAERRRSSRSVGSPEKCAISASCDTSMTVDDACDVQQDQYEKKRSDGDDHCDLHGARS